MQPLVQETATSELGRVASCDSFVCHRSEFRARAASSMSARSAAVSLRFIDRLVTGTCFCRSCRVEGKFPFSRGTVPLSVVIESPQVHKIFSTELNSTNDLSSCEWQFAKGFVLGSTILHRMVLSHWHSPRSILCVNELLAAAALR
jgi:hypothetical protein